MTPDDTKPLPDTREPGYCVICGDFHLITPVPGRSGGVCGSPSCQQRLEPPEPYVPGHHHVCGVGGEPRVGHAEYRQCRCGQWFHWGGSMWWKVRHPPASWLRAHGLGDAGAFWSYEDDPGPSAGELFTSTGGWRYLLRYFLRGRRS